MKASRRRVLMTLIIWLAYIWPVSAGEVVLPEELQNLYARSAVVMDGSSGRVLFGKNVEEVMPMASTTKIMTCILALEACTPDTVVTVSETAAAQPEVHLGASVGEKFYLEDLLYALMLESFNDAAVMIAEQVSGNVPAFAEQMNEKAKKIGCENTHFVTPNGLDETDEGGAHGTTAEDLARIMKYCTWDSPKSEAFIKITREKQHTFTNLSETRTYTCYNHNAFLDLYEGTISGKTGFTAAAGYCYVCAVERDGKRFTGVVLACGWPYNRTYKWKDMTRMMDYAEQHYRYVTLEYPQEIRYVRVENGWSREENPWNPVEVPVYVEKTETQKVLLGSQEKIVRHTEYRKKTEAPLQKDTVLGKVQFLLNGEVLQEKKILSKSSVEQRKMENWLVWTLQRFLF